MTSVTKDNRRPGFTIVEIMVVVTLFGFISIGLASFLISSQRGLFWASNKSKITNDVRLFTMRITQETLGARTAYVYDSFALSDRDKPGDRRESGQTGDCLVLIYYDYFNSGSLNYSPVPGPDDEGRYTKLVVFFRKPDSDGISPVYRAEKVFSSPQEIDKTKKFEDFLAAQFSNDEGDYPVVLELSRGLADGNLFRNFGNNTFVVNGEILHGNDVKEVTNTYNLTISPRG